VTGERTAVDYTSCEYDPALDELTVPDWLRGVLVGRPGARWVLLGYEEWVALERYWGREVPSRGVFLGGVELVGVRRTSMCEVAGPGPVSAEERPW
jgi:hypothetical protein